MARTVARAIQDLLGLDTDQSVRVQLAGGGTLVGRLDDLQQFDEAAILVRSNGRRTVISMSSIAAVELVGATSTAEDRQANERDIPSVHSPTSPLVEPAALS